MRHLLFFLIFIQTALYGQGIEADIGFFIADLKYNQKDGVKICEVQHGVLSAFKGYDHLSIEKGLMEEGFLEQLFRFQSNVFYRTNDPWSPYLKNKLKDHGAITFSSIGRLTQDDRFLQTALTPPVDPANLLDYHCVVITSPKILSSVEEFKRMYPGALVLDRSSYPYWKDKFTMSQLFRGDEILETIKPEWGLYPKKYTHSLAQTIYEDLHGAIFVIKPRGAFKGSGVLIVGRDDLDHVLGLIIDHKQSLKRSKDPDLKFWANETRDSFIVERFYPSDPLPAPLLDNQLYDGTMRVVFVMSYHNGQIEVDFIGSYWKLPALSLSKDGSLNERYKSCGKVPYFLPVADNVRLQVEAQLREAMSRLYARMLGLEG